MATVYGVDFSGARDAGASIWLTEATSTEEGLTVERAGRADDFLADHYTGATSTDRALTLAALAAFVRSRDDAAFGFDFPFSVPERIADSVFDAESWRGVVDEIADCEGADAFVERCVEWADDHADRTYLKRETDREHGAFSPYHFFVQNQTYHGIAGLLAAIESETRIVPFDASASGDPIVAETYPAGVLGELDLCREGYKGTDDAHRTRRERNLDGLTELADVTVSQSLREMYVDDHEGDALDSLLAAVAVHRNLGEWGHRPDLLEARIYV